MAEIGTATIKIRPEWEKPHLAEQIIVRQGPDGVSLEIDGQEFPWFISEDGVVSNASNFGTTTVNVSIVTNSLRTIQSQKKDALG